MSELDEFDRELSKRISAIAEIKLERFARRVIARIKKLPEECRLSGDDSALDSVWEEYKYQVQHEQSPYFEVYEEVIEGICQSVAAKVRREDRELIWLSSDEFIDWVYEEERRRSAPGDLETFMARTLFNHVLKIAADEEIKNDPSDDFAKDRMDYEISLLKLQKRPES